MPEDGVLNLLSMAEAVVDEPMKPHDEAVEDYAENGDKTADEGPTLSQYYDKKSGDCVRCELQIDEDDLIAKEETGEERVELTRFLMMDECPGEVGDHEDVHQEDFHFSPKSFFLARPEGVQMSHSLVVKRLALGSEEVLAHDFRGDLVDDLE